MFDYCSEKYTNLIKLYGDLNLYNIFDINFFEVTSDNLNSIDLNYFYNNRTFIILDNLNLIIEKSDKLKRIITDSVMTFSSYDIIKINNWPKPAIYFNPIVDEKQHQTNVFLDRTTESINYENINDYNDLQLFRNVKYINLNNVFVSDTTEIKILLERIYQFILCGCIINVLDTKILDELDYFILDRVNKPQFNYENYMLCTSKILDKYSFFSNIGKMDDSIKSVYGNPYIDRS